MTEEQLIQRKAMLLQLFEDPAYAPMKLKELAMLFDIPKEQREDLKEVLDTLLTEGKIGISQKGKYGKPDLGSIAGVFSATPKALVLLQWKGWIRIFLFRKIKPAVHFMGILCWCLPRQSRETAKGQRAMW